MAGFNIIEPFDFYPAATRIDFTGSLWSLSTDSPNCKVDTSNPRTGTRCLLLNLNGTNQAGPARNIDVPVSRVMFGAAFRFTSGSAFLNSTNAWGFGVKNSSDASKLMFKPRPNTNQFGLYTGNLGGTLRASSTFSLAFDTYYYVLCDWDGLNGNVDWWVNGVAGPSIVNDPIFEFANLGFPDRLQLGSRMNGSGNVRVDDLFCVVDPTAGQRSSLLVYKDFSITTSMPEANTAPQNWSHVGAASAWECLNNVPADIAKYIESSVGGDVSAFQLSDASANVLAVHAAQHYYSAAKTAVGIGNVQGSLNGGAGAVNPQSTSYVYWADTYPINPATGVTWAPSDLVSPSNSFESS